EEHADDAVAGHGEREAAEEAGPERVRVQPAARDLRLELRRSRQAEGVEFDREEPEPGRDPELAAQDRVRAIVADQEPAALFERLAGPQARYADAVLAVVDDVRDLGAADQIDLSGRDRGLEDQRAGRGRIGREGREVGSPEIRLLDAEERLAAAAEDRAVDRERGLRPDPRPDAEAVERVERRALEDLRPEPSRRAGLAFQDADPPAPEPERQREHRAADPAADDQDIRHVRPRGAFTRLRPPSTDARPARRA